MAIKRIVKAPNGVSVKLHNKRITIIQTDQKVMISFLFADKNPDKPACYHKCIKGKVRETAVFMTTEAMDALAIAYLKHKQHQSELETSQTPEL